MHAAGIISQLWPCKHIKDCLLRVTSEFEGKTSEEIMLHRERKYLDIGKKFIEN